MIPLSTNPMDIPVILLLMIGTAFILRAMDRVAERMVLRGAVWGLCGLLPLIVAYVMYQRFY